VQVSLQDLQGLYGAAARVDRSPFGLAGRALGLSGDEVRSVPGWAWGILIVGVGVAGGVWLEKSGFLQRLPGSK
jgi:hypothetical protein